MPERRPDATGVAPIGCLYELSLSVGTSLDLAEMCVAFCRSITDQLGLASTAVWIRGDRMGADLDSLVRAFSLPVRDTEPGSIARDHQLAMAVADVEAVSYVNDAWPCADTDNPACITVFRLADLGLFELVAADGREPLDASSLAQLGKVMAQFAAALGGCLDHRDLINAVNARRRVELVLRENQERLNLVLSGADLGTWDWNIITGEVAFDEHWAAMLGHDLNRLAPALSTWENLVHPDDLPDVMEKLQAHLDGATGIYESEHRMRHQDGRWIWILDRGRVLAWDAAGKPARAVGTHLDITRRRENEQRAQRLGLLREITSEVLNTFLETDDLDRAINMILQRAGRFFGVSRSYLFRYRESMTWLSNTHEWCAPGVEPQLENLKHLPASAFPWWNRELLAGRVIRIGDLAQADIDAQTREVLESQDIKALLVLPVVIHGRLEGFFGFDETESIRQWYDEETALLSVMVEAYARAVERTIAQRNQTATTRLLADALERAEKASQAQASFLARMSHEIRTPLFGIIGLSRALARTTLQADQREKVRTLMQSAQTLHDIIGDILDFSKLNEDKTRPEVQAFCPRDLLENLAQTYAEAARSRGLAFYCDLDPGLPDEVRVDPTHLRQVLGNLLANAVKFTDSGSISLDSEVRRDPGGRVSWLISVQDTGIGIPTEIHASIFEPFAQGDVSTRRVFEGTGLGLAIARQLVELMAGSIEVVSEPGKGARFTCVIPLDDGASVPDGATPEWTCPDVTGDDPRHIRLVSRQLASLFCKDGPRDDTSCDRSCRLARFGVTLVVHQGQLHVTRRHDGRTETAEFCLPVRTESLREYFQRLERREKPVTQQLATPAAPSATTTLAGCRILVVEDNEVNSLVIGDLLRHWGCDAEIVSDGEGALAAHGRSRYDVILTDIELPGRDGYDITQEVRRREEATGVRTPIIALTAHALSDVRSRCLAVGMDDFIVKPLDEDRLFDAIVRHRRVTLPATEVTPTTDRRRLWTATRGNLDLARRLVATFAASATAYVAEIAAAHARGEAEARRKVAHALKGSAMTVGATEVAELARELDAPTDGDAPATGSDAVADLASAVARSVQALEATLEQWSDRPDEKDQPEETPS